MQNQKFKEPFRKSLGAASQWLDILKGRVKEQVDETIKKAAEMGDALLSPTCNSDVHSGQGETPPKSDPSTDNTASNTQFCSRFLRQLCPACFNLKDFGRSLDVYALLFVWF